MSQHTVTCRNTFFFINVEANGVENHKWKVFVKIALPNCRGGRGQIKLC